MKTQNGQMIVETKKRKDILEEIIKVIEPLSVGVILEGSLSWGENTVITKKSDIDLEVIFESLSKLKLMVSSVINKTLLINEISLLIEDYEEYAEDCVFFTLNIFINEVKVSIRFMQINTFQNICSTSLIDMDSNLELLEYRNVSSESVGVYSQRNFFGEQIKIKRKFRRLKSKGQITSVPASILKDGKYYPGALVDRYISYPTILCGQQSTLESNFRSLRLNIMNRMKYEMKRGNTKNVQPGLHLMLSRHDKIPTEIKTYLRHQTNELYSFLS